MKKLLALAFTFCLFQAHTQSYDRALVAKLRAEKKEKAAEDSIAAMKQRATDDSVKAANNAKMMADARMQEEYEAERYLQIDSGEELAEFALAKSEKDIKRYMDSLESGDLYLLGAEEEMKQGIVLRINKNALKIILIVGAVNAENAEDMQTLEESQKQWEKYKAGMIKLNNKQTGEFEGDELMETNRMKYENELIERRITELMGLEFEIKEEWKEALEKYIQEAQKNALDDSKG